MPADPIAARLGKQSCPVCGEVQDFTTEEGQLAALEHTQKDQAHRDHLARSRLSDLMNTLCSTGILRRVPK